MSAELLETRWMPREARRALARRAAGSPVCRVQRVPTGGVGTQDPVLSLAAPTLTQDPGPGLPLLSVFSSSFFAVLGPEPRAFALSHTPCSCILILRCGLAKLLKCTGWSQTCSCPASASQQCWADRRVARHSAPSSVNSAVLPLSPLPPPATGHPGGFRDAEPTWS